MDIPYIEENRSKSKKIGGDSTDFSEVPTMSSTPFYSAYDSISQRNLTRSSSIIDLNFTFKSM